MPRLTEQDIFEICRKAGEAKIRNLHEQDTFHGMFRQGVEQWLGSLDGTPEIAEADDEVVGQRRTRPNADPGDLWAIGARIAIVLLVLIAVVQFSQLFGMAER